MAQAHKHHRSMKTLKATYKADEDAWVTNVVELERDIYLKVSLKQPGKIVLRQEDIDGGMPRVPIKRHKDTSEFFLRISVVPKRVKVQLFTSTEPKEITYAYI